jgi:hypothetical protein
MSPPLRCGLEAYDSGGGSVAVATATAVIMNNVKVTRIAFVLGV